ncbi:hypothetical protein [Desmonostoc muscorum]|nr:hypothetical protein [Desmonostoc muscorum]
MTKRKVYCVPWASRREVYDHQNFVRDDSPRQLALIAPISLIK